MSKAKPKQNTHPKERGTWLTVWLILMVVWSIGGTILLWYYRNQETTTIFSWAIPALVLLNLADIVGVAAIWFWKRWGLTLILITTGLAIAVGLIVTRSQLIAFHEIIPLVILGFLVKPHQKQFE
jgi:hypothetical protein